MARVLAASTGGKSHKSSFTIVLSHWRECSRHSREYSRQCEIALRAAFYWPLSWTCSCTLTDATVWTVTMWKNYCFCLQHSSLRFQLLTVWQWLCTVCERNIASEVSIFARRLHRLTAYSNWKRCRLSSQRKVYRFEFLTWWCWWLYHWTIWT